MRQQTSQPLTQDQLQKLRRTDKLWQYFSQLNEQRKNLQFLSLLSSTQNKVIFLDQQKQFVIVQVNLLEELKSNVERAQGRARKIVEDVAREHVDKEMFAKIVEGRDGEIVRLRTQVSGLEKRVVELEDMVKNGERMLDQKEEEINQVMAKYERELFTLRNQGYEDFLRNFTGRNTKVSTWAQTELIDQSQLPIPGQLVAQNQAENPQSPSNKNDQPHRSQIESLKQNFQQILKQLNTKINSKLEELENEKLSIEKYQKENAGLREENKKLRQEIVHFNEQEHKLKVWKNSLQNYIQSIQIDHRIETQTPNPNLPHPSPSSVPSTDHSNLNRQKIRIMQASIDRMLLQKREREKKIEEIRIILDEAADFGAVSEENIVGCLLGLSGKIKEVVRFLLEEL